MGETSTASIRRYLPIVFVSILLAATPTAGWALGEGPTPVGGSFLTFDQLPAPSPPEERFAAYEKALAKLAATSEEGRQTPRSMSSFIDVAVDFSSLVDPEDALVLAYILAPTPTTAELYEQLGVALLRAAREDRLGEELERARDHLRAARHAFALADRGLATGDPAHRDDSEESPFFTISS